MWGTEGTGKKAFSSKTCNEDRCHLNGLALVDGFPRYVTACSQSDVVDGWRDRRVAGGCVIDIQNNEILVQGLSMPHSPRFYQGKLWLLNSGTCDSAEQYEQQAIAFGNNPALLKPIHTKLRSDRELLTLFNLDQFAQNLESVYLSLWDKCDV